LEDVVGVGLTDASGVFLFAIPSNMSKRRKSASDGGAINDREHLSCTTDLRSMDRQHQCCSGVATVVQPQDGCCLARNTITSAKVTCCHSTVSVNGKTMDLFLQQPLRHECIAYDEEVVFACQREPSEGIFCAEEIHRMTQIQIFPMSVDYLDTNQTIDDFFTRSLHTVSKYRPKAGRFNYKSQGVGALPGSYLLFQYKGGLVAHAQLISTHDKDHDSPADSEGFFLLDPPTVQYYSKPIAAGELQHIWPGLAFNQRKHILDGSQLQTFLDFTKTR
jgi:hypothetical protein